MQSSGQPAAAPVEPAVAAANATTASAEKSAASPAESEPASDATKEAPAKEDGKKEASAKTASDEQAASNQAAAKEPEPPAGDSARPDGDGRAARRAKRAARRAAAAEARRPRRAVAEASTAAEPEREVASPASEPGSTFDRQAAQTALAASAEQAKNCRPIGGPSGAGTVQVTYEPSGKVASVTIVTPGFENSEAAGCIEMLFRRAKVPAFNGAKTAVMRQRFEIP